MTIIFSGIAASSEDTSRGLKQVQHVELTLNAIASDTLTIAEVDQAKTLIIASAKSDKANNPFDVDFFDDVTLTISQTKTNAVTTVFVQVIEFD